MLVGGAEMSIQKYAVTGKDAIRTLLDFLACKMDISKKKAKQFLDRRLVFVNKKRVWIASYLLHEGDAVEIVAGRPREPNTCQKPIEANLLKHSVLFQDSHYLIVTKPYGVVTNGPNSLESDLKTILKNSRLRAVHRLDKDTSGAVIFAMDTDAFERMKALFKHHLITKVYRAIVRGRVGKQAFTINSPINMQKAMTCVKLLERGKEASYLEVTIETGRTHQIRIHLASIGHPVLGEMEYDRKPIESPVLRQVQRHMLHAHRLSFVHPYTQETVTTTAKIPEDFQQCLTALFLAKEQGTSPA